MKVYRLTIDVIQIEYNEVTFRMFFGLTLHLSCSDGRTQTRVVEIAPQWGPEPDAT